ncbi:MAG TPA: hypothetical protein VHD33_07420 [Legionellaceae bacterium]|nr:hypothetical protein [Legionellaceae bacterium]
MAKNWMTALQKHDGYVSRTINPLEGLIRMPTPSVGFALGPPHGLVRGRSMVLSGPSEGGKSYFLNAIIGQLHKDDPNSIAIKYDTEFRDEGQLTPEQAALLGVDLNRYTCYSVNTPEGIFDHITHDVAALCDDGMPLALIAIDSLNNIQGIRMTGNDSVMDQTIGDLAQTLKIGLTKVLPIQKKFRIGLIHVAQVRSEMDQLEIRRGNKLRIALPHTAQHLIDYWAYIEPNKNKEGKTDLSGEELVDGEKMDALGNADAIGHKIRFKLKKSSYGIKGRTGEFTINYRKGIVNTFEEAFLLGVNRKVIERPNNLTYSFGAERWVGKPAILDALKTSPALCDAIIQEVYKRDLNPKDDDTEITSENSSESDQ